MPSCSIVPSPKAMPPVWKGQFVQNFFVAQREVVSDTKVAVDGLKALDRKRPDPFACFQATDFHATLVTFSSGQGHKAVGLSSKAGRRRAAAMVVEEDWGQTHGSALLRLYRPRLRDDDTKIDGQSLSVPLSRGRNTDIAIYLTWLAIPKSEKRSDLEFGTPQVHVHDKSLVSRLRVVCSTASQEGSTGCAARSARTQRWVLPPAFLAAGLSLLGAI